MDSKEHDVADTIYSISERVVNYVNEYLDPMTFIFNGISVPVTVGDTQEMVLQYYMNALEKRDLIAQ